MCILHLHLYYANNAYHRHTTVLPVSRTLLNSHCIYHYAAEHTANHYTYMYLNKTHHTARSLGIRCTFNEEQSKQINIINTTPLHSSYYSYFSPV